MASARVPGIHRWGNVYYPWLPSVLRSLLWDGGGLRTPFLLDCGVAGIADHLRLHVCISSVFLRLAQGGFPTALDSS